MASTLALLLPLLVSVVSASHHFGGTVTFAYKGRHPDGSHKVVIRNRDTFDGCLHSHSWSCHEGNCGNISSNRSGVIDQSQNAPQANNEWCETETVVTKKLWSDKPFKELASSCCWIPTRHGQNNNWRLQTLVDLGRRSDTGKPNRSPEIAVLPFLRVPQNCPRTYHLMSSDGDDDQVRCRYGTANDSECSSCNKPSGFHLNQDSCTLYYRNESADPKVFGFELVVEDFPRSHITLTYSDDTQSSRSPLPKWRRKRQATATTQPWHSTTTESTTTPDDYTWPPHTTYAITDPLSKLPMQFSFLVDPPAPSCHEGVYLPKFVHPTPPNGARMYAEINKELEITVKAEATYATVHNIIISGPLNVTKHMGTHGEFFIRWTPHPHDLGDYHPICFAVEAKANGTNSGNRIYQSEMRCILLNVKSKEVNADVVCNQTSMTVSIDRASLHGVSEDHLQLSDPTNIACSFQTHSNSSHIVAVVPLNACGTQIKEEDDNLLFRNEITFVDKSTDLITRKHQLEVEFCCQYPKRGNVTLSFTAHRKNVTVLEKGYGTFTYSFEFFPDNQYQKMIDPKSYPVEFYLKSRIYMQIEATSSLNNTELFIDSCTASPYDTPNYHPSYTIIENGCKVDPTVEVYPPQHNKQFRFSIEAFKFIGLHDQVFITCSVLMCEAKNPYTRAAQGCINSTSVHHFHHHHRKREAIIQSGNHFISQGPLRLRRSAESNRATVTNLNMNLNLVFIAGCLLAAVGMICGVVLYKSKMSKAKYQTLIES